MADESGTCENSINDLQETESKPEKCCDNSCEETQTNSELIELLNSKIKSLEDMVKLQTGEKVKIKDEVETLQNLVSHLKAELRQKVDHLTKLYEDERRDKESMVLKFAQAEQKNLDMLKKVKELEGRLRESKFNLDTLNNEKEKINKELKMKNSDFSTYERELNNLKASLTIAEQKLKMEKVRFDEEVEKNKDTKKKYDEMQRSINVIKEENSTLRQNCQEIVKKYQNSEDMLSNSLSSSLRQMKEELKKCQEEKKEAVESYNKIAAELQVNKSTINSLNQELKNVREKLKHVEADKMCQEETIKQLKDAIKGLTFVKDQLTDRISYLEPFESNVEQVNQENDRLIVTNSDLRKINEDNETVLNTLRQKESELLEFIQTLSNKNAELQTEKHEWLKEREVFQQQLSKFEQQYKDAVIKINFWENKFKSESKKWLEERDHFTKKIDNLTTEMTTTNQKLLDSNDQIYSLKKKHKAHIKDLTRQLTKLNASDFNKLSDQKDVYPYSAGPSKLASLSHSNSDESRNSNQNLNDKDELEPKNGDNNHKHLTSQNSPVINGKSDFYVPTQAINRSTLSGNQPLEIHMIEPHNQVFIDKIIKLQQTNAKFQEKIEFLNEHTVQLTQDIQRKALLLRYLFSQSEDKGSVKSDSIDDNHIMMSKKGGIMASVFSSRQADENMTLELSLEINRRLQSVLEDTTIKNFTLKDSINTLGEEISKLSCENHRLKDLLSSS